MKRILFLLIIIGVSLKGNAQEMDSKFKAIPPKNKEVKEVVPPKEDPPKADPDPVLGKTDELKIDPTDLFKNPALYKKDANVEGIPYRRNQYLGGYKIKTFKSTVRFRDAAFVDGDKIKMYLNDKVVEAEVSLVGEFKEFKITLIPGINKIDFEALNEGFASPNTAEYQVYDEKGTEISSSQWNVGTGYKATIILYKE